MDKICENIQNKHLEKLKFATIKEQIRILKVQNFSKPSYDMQNVEGLLLRQKIGWSPDELSQERSVFILECKSR